MWNTNRSFPSLKKIKPVKHPIELAPKTPQGQGLITHIGISQETVRGKGAYIIGISKNGLGNGLGDGIGDGNGSGFGFSGYLKILRQRIWSEWAQCIAPASTAQWIS